MMTSPPRPPSPPEGPPRGTNFSRRKAMHPLPPLPALIEIRASSMNISYELPVAGCQLSETKWHGAKAVPGCGSPVVTGNLQPTTCNCLLRFYRLDGDELAHVAAVLEHDFAGDLGEKGVVLAAANVEAGLDRCAALTHDDGAAGDQFAAVRLGAKPLRV